MVSGGSQPRLPAIQASSFAFGTAPTRRDTSLPDRISSIVGMLLASNRMAVRGEVSTLTFTSLIAPARSVATRSSSGEIVRQGPHHGAHRSTNTGMRAPTTASKSSSVAAATHGSGALHAAHFGVPLATAGTRLRVPQDGQAVMEEALMTPTVTWHRGENGAMSRPIEAAPPPPAAAGAAPPGLAVVEGFVFRSLRGPRSSREERLARGRALRETVPHAALGEWAPPAGRPDPIALIEASNEGRLLDLIAVRVGRMAASPYGFLRGAAAVTASDVATLPASGIMPVICGDCHMGNFGFYRSAEGALVIDLNDFDEAHPGSWEWDLRRLTASIWVAGRENGYREDQCAEAVRSCVRDYRDEVTALAYQPLLSRSFNHLDAEGLQESATEATLRDEIRRASKAARKRTSDRALPRYTEESDGGRRIVAEPPLVTPITGADYDAIADGLDDYIHTLPPHWRRVFAGYSLVDIALKVVGVGSVGLRAYIALLEGSADDVLFLQLKEARRSVVAPFVHGGQAWHTHQGQRVVEYQQAVQTVSDPLLGWTTIDGRQFYVRQFRNMKGQVPLNALTASALSDYAGIQGHLLAKGHARTSGASLIAGYLGSDDGPAEAFAQFARRYADQTESDHELLLHAARLGRLPIAEPPV